MKPTIITWIIAIFGVITFVPLMIAQFVMITAPKSKLASDLIIGKGGTWRDQTHIRSALAFAWGDLLLLFPLLIAGYAGVFTGHLWGYVIWFALGILSVYFSILFWVLEKSYTYPVVGWLTYYTYIWGSFLYWGIAAVIHSSIQLF